VTTRREFVAASLAAAALTALGDGAEGPDDEAYWASIRRAFALDPTVIYLNSAGLSPTPSSALEEEIRDERFTNSAPVEHLWRVLEPRVEVARQELAKEFGCDPEELAIVRNASEAMETLIQGLDLKHGDEVIVSAQNYDRMLTAWDQRAARDGIIVKRVALTIPTQSDATVVAAIEAAITPRTRAIELPHLTNWTGQPLPIRAIVDLARPHGIDVLVDGAQTFAHTPVSRDALACDYYGTSLHKWLLAPLGTGFLYVRREKIPKIWPLFAAAAAKAADIRKFEEIGTHPAAPHNAIVKALAFHREIGSARKLARLRLLRDRWARPLGEEPRVRIRTPLDDPRSGAIALMEIDGLDPVTLARWLWSRHRIITSPVSFGGVTGLRITPNVFTSLPEIDRTADALHHAIHTGLD
jgi:selenocysteine lyase/cysteine desulfurase